MVVAGASPILLVMTIFLARGRFGPSRISSNGHHTYYDAVTLTGGEGRPAAVVLAWHALVWPALIAGLIL
jgi:hypothetical protein